MTKKPGFSEKPGFFMLACDFPLVTRVSLGVWSKTVDTPETLRGGGRAKHSGRTTPEFGVRSSDCGGEIIGLRRGDHPTKAVRPSDQGGQTIRPRRSDHPTKAVRLSDQGGQTIRPRVLDLAGE